MSGAGETVGEELVLVEGHGDVGLVVLNRPQKLNAFAGEMRDRIGDAIESLGADPAVRAIVITGEGRGFCAGADIDYLNELVAEENARARKRENGFLRKVKRIFE